MEGFLTVGLDGSPESLAAARWAAGEAVRRDLPLRLLHAWPQLAPEPTRIPAEVEHNHSAKLLVRSAQAELQKGSPGLTVVSDLVAEDPRDALLRAASESKMLVLGSRGVTSAESYFFGDVSMSVVSCAERPVILVRADRREEGHVSEAGAPGEVVVALKLHGSCDELLAFAFTTAEARGVPVRVAHGRSLPVHAYASWGLDRTVTQEQRQEAQKSLDQALRPWREKFPGVAVADMIRLDSPARTVVGAAVNAGLLIVGRRRHHPPLTPRLGPVTQAAAHHARCPVAVVPHD
ncbi:universal stress protein [Streptomyces sp. NPDC002640]